MEKCKTCKLYDFCHTYPVTQFREFPGRDGNLYPNCYKPKEEAMKEKNEIFYTGEQFEKLIRNIVKEEIRKQQTAKMPYGFFQKGKVYLRTKPSKTGDPIHIGIRLQFKSEDSYYFYFLCLSNRKDIELNKNDYNDMNGWIVKEGMRKQQSQDFSEIYPEYYNHRCIIVPIDNIKEKEKEIDQPILWTGLQEQKISEVIKHYTDALNHDDFLECFAQNNCPFCKEWRFHSIRNKECPNAKINEILNINKTGIDISCGSEKTTPCSINSYYFHNKGIDNIRNGYKKPQIKIVVFFRLKLWLDSLYMPKGQFIAKYKKA